MKKVDIFEHCRRIIQRPLPFVQKEKARHGRPVIGYFLGPMPEEIIHAGGAHPLALWGGAETISHAEKTVPGYVCSPVKAVMEQGMKGDLNFLDFMFIPYFCDSSRVMIHAWRESVPKVPADSLRLPKKTDGEEVRQYLKSEMGRFREKVAHIVGREITDSDLMNSLRIHDRNRDLLRRIYAGHASHPEALSNTAMYRLIQSSLVMMKEDHTRLLEALIPQLEEEPHAPEEDWVPIFLKGKIGEPLEIMELFDALKIRIVGDDLLSGTRSISGEVQEEGDPLDTLVTRHLGLSPYQGFHYPMETWSRFLPEAVKRAHAKGVIFLSQKFCEPAAFNEPDLKRILDRAGIPSLSLQTVMGDSAIGQLRLRVQAFKEMIQTDDLFFETY